MEALSTRNGLQCVDGEIGGELPFQQLCYVFYVQKVFRVSSNHTSLKDSLKKESRDVSYCR